MNLDTLPLMGTLDTLCEALNVSRHFARCARFAAGYGNQRTFQLRPVVEWVMAPENKNFKPTPVLESQSRKRSRLNRQAEVVCKPNAQAKLNGQRKPSPSSATRYSAQVR